VRRAGVLVALAALAAASPGEGGEIAGATLILEAAVGLPGRIPGAAPPRFVLKRDGQVFVGGSAVVYAGQLDEDEAEAIEDRVKGLRKSHLLAPTVSFGDDSTKRYRLRLLKDDPLDVVITGDPASAPPALEPLAAFVEALSRFDHRTLRPLAPAEYAVSAREGRLVGGCRPWYLPLPFERVLAGPQRLAADEAERWPSGADPASVCHEGRRYVVTLRPLLPGEQP
jgi:hypothetical protein